MYPLGFPTDKKVWQFKTAATIVFLRRIKFLITTYTLVSASDVDFVLGLKKKYRTQN